MDIFVAIVLVLAVGIATAAQSPTNASLGLKVGVFQASLVSFAGGFVILLVICLVTGSVVLFNPLDFPAWKLLGGVYAAFIIFSMAYCSPVLGVALTMTAFMVGQLLGGAAIDFLGLLEAVRVEATPLRVIGCILALAGIVVVYFGNSHPAAAQKSPRERAAFTLLAFVGGLASALQTPTNAAMAASIGVLQLSTFNFLVGAVIMLVVTLIVNRGRLHSFAGAKPWEFTGGIYGAFGVPALTAATPVLGTSLALCGSMLAQMVGAFAVDRHGWFATQRIPIDKLRIVGACILGVGVVLVTLSKL